MTLARLYQNGAPDKPRAGLWDAAFTARPAIDNTPAPRGRIRVAAIRHGLTVDALLRNQHGRAVPPNAGDHP